MIEIAALLGVVEKTVHTWRFRQILPPADYASVNGNAAWTWRTVLEWAGRTGHIRDDDAGRDAAAQYRDLFGADPAPHRKGGRIVDTAPAESVDDGRPPPISAAKALAKRPAGAKRASKARPAPKKAAARKAPAKKTATRK
jgi:hypothetical protein